MASQIFARQFSGTLQLFSVPESLQLISCAGKSGVLAFGFENADLDFKVAFKNGRVVGVNGKNVPRLSEALLRLGVSATIVGQIGMELSQMRSSDTQDSPILGSLDRRILEQALELRTIAGLLLIWDNTDGSFNFVPMESPPSTCESGLATHGLILEAARRMDELQANAKAPIDPLDVYAVAERIGDFSGRITTLLPIDWALLTELDGQTSLAQIGLQTFTPWNELLQSVIALESVGLIELKAAQRGVQARYAQLEVGDFAPAFSLPALNASTFSLGSLRGQHTLLSFHRHGGCPWCNLRVHQLIESFPRLQAVGVSVVSVFSGQMEGIANRVGQQRPPFTLLSDADDAVHTLYGTQFNPFWMLHPQIFAKYLEAKSKRMGISHGKIEGSVSRMPADFLIGPDLRIEAVQYASHAAEHMDIDQIERWGRTGSVAVQPNFLSSAGGVHSSSAGNNSLLAPRSA